jgi:hypothetical protein
MSQLKFKVGDRVRIEGSNSHWNGMTGVVEQLVLANAPFPCLVMIDQTQSTVWFKQSSLVLEQPPSPTGTDLRREALREVESCVCRDRQNTYGDAEDNFAHIAAIANVVLGDKLTAPLTPLDVASFSACIKLARIRSSPLHEDNWRDLGGYAVCGQGIIKRQQCKPSSADSTGPYVSVGGHCETPTAGAVSAVTQSLSAARCGGAPLSTP